MRQWGGSQNNGTQGGWPVGACVGACVGEGPPGTVEGVTEPFATPEELTAAIDTAAGAAGSYYTDGAVVMDDATYDALVARIAATVTAQPDWDADTSVLTAVAAGAYTTAGTPVTHDAAMLSLDNVFAADELTTWWQRLAALVGEGAGVCVEPKLDGVAVSLRYHNGTLAVVATRGDGVVGEDVTGVARRAAGVLETVKLTAATSRALGVTEGRFEVRGEMVMTDADFDAANELRTAEGKPAFVNPRNAAAGTLRRADSVAPLTFAAYDVVGAGDHHDAMDALERLGFITARSLTGATGALLTDAAGVQAAIDALANRRAGLGVGIDGAVVKVALATLRARAGDNGRAPRWAIAYKYPADLRLTKLVDIEISVGRTGVLTPVAVLEPVFVGGATVSAASLANPSEVVRKDLRIGDMVWVRRAGDVIPEVTGVHLDARDPASVAWTPPSACPRCGAGVDTSSRRWRCAAATCGLAEQLAYLASRKALDIDGFGPELAERIVDAGLVADVADVFTLTVDQLTGLERVGDTSATSLIERIAEARTRPLDRVICALGIEGTGSRLSRRLAGAFGSLDALVGADADALSQVEGIGTVKAAGIAEQLADLGGVIAKLQAAGVTSVADTAGADATAAGPWVGKTVVVTGKVPGMTRDEATTAVEALGGVAGSSVTGRTSLVVVGDGAGGAKLAKIDALGVPTLTATEFLALVKSVG